MVIYMEKTKSFKVSFSGFRLSCIEKEAAKYDMDVETYLYCLAFYPFVDRKLNGDFNSCAVYLESKRIQLRVDD